MTWKFQKFDEAKNEKSPEKPGLFENVSISLQREMARVTGLEPATSGVTGRHSNQLSYTRAFFKRNSV